MKVSRLGGSKEVRGGGNSEKISKSQNFSTAMDLANREQTEQKLSKMLKDIEALGKRFISTRSLEDAREYKKKVQEYLGYIVKNIYILKREPGPFNYGIHTRIEIINQKLDEVTKSLIEEQRETIVIADRIEEIKGLLVDVYK